MSRQQARLNAIREFPTDGSSVVELLGLNLKAMARLMDRMGMQERAAVFRAVAAELEDPKKYPEGVLPPPKLRGNWQADLDKLAWHLQAGELKAAAKLM